MYPSWLLDMIDDVNESVDHAEKVDAKVRDILSDSPNPYASGVVLVNSEVDDADESASADDFREHDRT